MRRTNPRFVVENFQRNLDVVARELEENAGALDVTLTAADLANPGVARWVAFAGDRYEDMRCVGGVTPTRLEV